MKPLDNTETLSGDMFAMFVQAPKWTKRESAALSKAAQALDADPAFQADYLKELFVEQILQAMETEGISQSELARHQ